MKTIKNLLLALMLLVGVSATAQEKKAKYAEVLFSVSMDCGHCKANVEKNIPFEKGVKDMKVDLEKKTVWIKYQTAKTTEDALKKSLEKLDFTVKVIKEEPKKK